MAIISHEEFVRAAVNWDKFWGCYDGNWPSFKDHGFSQFMGFKADTDCRWAGPKNQEVWVPDHSLAKWQMLAGPHHETILKVYKIQNDL